MRQHFFSLKNSTSFRQNMLKFYRIFRIAWKFLAKFVECRLKKLYYTAFFSKIFRQDFSARFFGKIFRQDFSARFFAMIRQQTTTFFASPGFRCRNMSKKIVIFCRFDKIIQSFSTCARGENGVGKLCQKIVSKNDGERCLSKDVCRKMLSSWLVDS